MTDQLLYNCDHLYAQIKDLERENRNLKEEIEDLKARAKESDKPIHWAVTTITADELREPYPERVIKFMCQHIDNMCKRLDAKDNEEEE